MAAWVQQLCGSSGVTPGSLHSTGQAGCSLLTKLDSVAVASGRSLLIQGWLLLLPFSKAEAQPGVTPHLLMEQHMVAIPLISAVI